MTKATVSTEQLFALIEKLKTENEALKKSKATPIGVKVKLGEAKGNIVITNLFQRYAMSFYAQQLEWILDNEKVLRDFMKANADKLSRK